MVKVRTRLQTCASLLRRYELIILFLASPLFLFPTPARAPTLLLIPCFWLVSRMGGLRPLPDTPLDGAFFFLVLMALVSIVVSADIAFSLSKIAGFIFGIVCFYATVRWIGRNQRRLMLAMQVFVLMGGGLALVALLGVNWINKVPILSYVTDRLPKLIRGLAGAQEGFQPNAVGGSLILFIPLQLSLVVNSLRRQRDGIGVEPDKLKLPRIVQLSLLALTAATLVLSQSRGAWLGLSVGLGAFLTLSGTLARKLLAALALFGLILVLVLGPTRVIDLSSRQLGFGMKENVITRVELWSRAISAISDFPFTGMGMNMFRKVRPILYPSPSIASDFDVTHAHNHLLQVALDLGLPGLVAYLAIWLEIGFMIFWVRFRSGLSDLGQCAIGLGTGLIAHFIFGMSDAIALGAKVGLLFWLDLALVVGLFQVAHSRRIKSPETESVPL